jgi:NAD(P)-dependent dehydrogenase (short-subunit alcohol dehydrogenase family)
MSDPSGASRRVAVVTGGASGFGLALADGCAERGFTVVVVDRDGERAEAEAAALAAAHGVETLGLHVDVGDPDAVQAAAAAVFDRYEKADLVISNVGVQLFGSVERMTDDEWRWLLDVNVIGSARVARAFLPLLYRATVTGPPATTAPKARLAFTTSSSVLAPASRLAAYQASKFAVWGLAETVRLEFAEQGIGVSVIFPSGMVTRHLETSTEAQPDHLRRPIGEDADFTAMLASNPAMAQDVIAPAEAATGVIDALLAGERYVITHGDLLDAIDTRSADLRRAAEAAARG